MASAGLGKLHLAAFSTSPESVSRLKAAGFDSTTAYNITASEHAALPAHPLDNYADLITRHEAIWRSMDGGVLPHLPVVTSGWDPSPRWVTDCGFPPPNRGYPYTTIVTNNTPELFGELCGKALDYCQSARQRPAAILVNAWNEWTEGSALLPDRQYQTRFLEELDKALNGNSR